MPIFKIVFTNQAVPVSQDQHTPHSFAFRIDASTSDEAMGLAQIEFSQKQPQLSHVNYKAHVAEDDGAAAQRVHKFDEGSTFNADK